MTHNEPEPYDVRLKAAEYLDIIGSTRAETIVLWHNMDDKQVLWTYERMMKMTAPKYVAEAMFGRKWFSDN